MAKLSPLEKAERELVKEYRWRQRRYSQSTTGIRSNGGNCFNEARAADHIAELERKVEDLGGDAYACLKAAREKEDAHR